MDWKGAFKKLGKVIGIALVGGFISHNTDNTGQSMKKDITNSVLIAIAAAIKTEGKKEGE